MPTTENKDYGESAGLQVCMTCGLHAKDLVGDPPRCPVTQRCDAVKNGQSLGGGKQWPNTKYSNFELDTAEQNSVKRAVISFQSKEAEEKAEGAIQLMAILDEVKTKRVTAGQFFQCTDCAAEFLSPEAVLLHRQKEHV